MAAIERAKRKEHRPDDFKKISAYFGVLAARGQVNPSLEKQIQSRIDEVDAAWETVSDKESLGRL